MQELLDRVKQQLEDINKNYKQNEDLKRRQLDFEFQDLVMEHLRK